MGRKPLKEPRSRASRDPALIATFAHGVVGVKVRTSVALGANVMAQDMVRGLPESTASHALACQEGGGAQNATHTILLHRS